MQRQIFVFAPTFQSYVGSSQHCSQVFNSQYWHYLLLNFLGHHVTLHFHWAGRGCLLLMKAHWFDLKTSTMSLNYDMWQAIRWWTMISKRKVIHPPVLFVSNVLDSNEVASSINKEHRTGHGQTWWSDGKVFLCDLYLSSLLSSNTKFIRQLITIIVVSEDDCGDDYNCHWVTI